MENPLGDGGGTTSVPPFLALTDIHKVYGHTVANKDVSLTIGRGEVVGLVGANGAGKSTLMRMIYGATEPTSGSLRIDGREIDLRTYSPRVAHRYGVHIVWQELSLCPNLSVAENFFIEQPRPLSLSPFWRGRYREEARAAIERIFPGAAIDPSQLVGELSIAERQMVEIARSSTDPSLRLLILDEPTSSLGAERSTQLRRYVRDLADRGVAAVFISHKLGEVLAVSDRVVAMRGGRVVWRKPVAETSIDGLVGAMGGGAESARSERTAGRRTEGPATVLARLSGMFTRSLGRDVELTAGTVVGLAGLDGSGQRECLARLFAPDGGGDATRAGAVKYVSGDRQREGVFPLWDVFENIAIGAVARIGGLRAAGLQKQRPDVEAVSERLKLDRARLGANILQLSGGNQQKALVARALIDSADVFLFDDPTRGVDIAAKRDFYRLVRDLADSGKLVVWHSSEDLEFMECDEVLVFSRGEIVADLAGADITEEKIVASSFVLPASAVQEETAARRNIFRGLDLLAAIPFIGLFAVFGAMTWINPLVASSFGIELLLAPAVTLVLVALAQMFVVGGSEIDLGVGAFTGYVNVLSATLLVASPLVGALGLAGGLAGYALTGLLIQWRAIPAIVATLGASFIWAGVGYTLQPTPGGSSPPWLVPVFAWNVPGVPAPLAIIIVFTAIAWFIDRSPVGVVLRGFGANPDALVRSGWSAVRYSVLRYLIASVFAMVAGLYVTAANNASDINAGNAFTLLSIAAVVIGGCKLLGGFVSPLGVAAGAVTLSLIGALLASLRVSTDYNAAVQGMLLISILALGAIFGRRRDG